MWSIRVSDGDRCNDWVITLMVSQIAKFMGPTWGPPGSCWLQMCPMLAPWTLLPRLARQLPEGLHLHTNTAFVCFRQRFHSISSNIMRSQRWTGVDYYKSGKNRTERMLNLFTLNCLPLIFTIDHVVCRLGFPVIFRCLPCLTHLTAVTPTKS